MNDHYPANCQPVIVVRAGPAGCTAALLLADSGIPVTLLERYRQPHPLPRAVHLDDEVARVLDRIGISEGFLARSRPGSGLRLLDARHRVMAVFSRDQQPGHRPACQRTGPDAGHRQAGCQAAPAVEPARDHGHHGHVAATDADANPEAVGDVGQPELVNLRGHYKAARESQRAQQQ